MRSLPPLCTAKFIVCSLLLLCSFRSPAFANVYNVKTNCGAAGNGVTDDTSAINACIRQMASGDTLEFPAGTYLTSGQLTVAGLSNITIDGSNNTAIIRGTTGGTSMLLVVGNTSFGGSFGTPVALSATANELSNSFTTASSLGVSAGDYVYLRQGGTECSGCSNWQDPTQCDTSACRGEILQVATVSGNTVTVTTSLHDSYNPSVNGAVAERVLNPVTGVTVQNITLDGSGTVGYGLNLNNVMNSKVSGVTGQHFTWADFVGGANFNLTWNTITATSCGSSTTECTAFLLSRQGSPSVSGLSISNLFAGGTSICSPCGAFGFELLGGANGTFSNISVDATGAWGRPWKTTAARYNTFNSITVKNGPEPNNGVAIEYYSAHNNYNNCVVTNNGGTGTGNGNAGINLFGNFTQYNTFSGCTVSGNGNVQIYDSAWYGTSPAASTGGNNSYLGNTIAGPGVGVLVNNPNACVSNNTFNAGSGLSSGISVSFSSDVGSGNVMNNYSSNLLSQTCGTSTAPNPPTGLAAVVM